MVDQADCLVSYIIRQYGGAYQTYRYAQRKIHPYHQCSERSATMPKMIIIECSDEEADRMVEQLKNMIAEYEYHPYHGPGKVYEFGSLRIDQPKQEVTIDGVMVDLTAGNSKSSDYLPSTQTRLYPQISSTTLCGLIQTQTTAKKKWQPISIGCGRS